MRSPVLRIFFFLTAAAACFAADESVDSLKAHVDKASTEDRAEISIRIAQLQLRAADKLYNEGRVADARAAVDDIARFSEKARDAAVESKKHLKSTEIAARKMSEKLLDIKRTLAFEDQAPVDQAVRRLEEVRTILLKEMFADKKDKKK